MGIVELCQCKESSINFFAGALYMGNLIPIISFLASVSCLSNLQNSATLSRAYKRACFSLRAASICRSKEKFSSPERESSSPRHTKTGSGRP